MQILWNFVEEPGMEAATLMLSITAVTCALPDNCDEMFLMVTMIKQMMLRIFYPKDEISSNDAFVKGPCRLTRLGRQKFKKSTFLAPSSLFFCLQSQNWMDFLRISESRSVGSLKIHPIL